ncbi:hypothetical protein Q5741_02605 [Paenibacillus sp. JX-17]|uniref:Pectate lyase superfamily protein domain-containing protein n=1 Tax=Paenibacillus lacisoli TaxID=3064525 RepID=A0ABT9C9P3_9BACL|nr:hypothetical protein [Paenibacillus sp. JX-17]MDO7905303.1 hypothetical protein [Paenibacillus sp. JX-17]
MRVNVKDYTGRDDTERFQAAADHASTLGDYVEVYVPAGRYYLTRIAGYVEIPAHDDGTVMEGYGTPLEPEPISKMPYIIDVPYNVKFVGESRWSTVIYGPYVYGNADLQQPIGFMQSGRPDVNGVIDRGVRGSTVYNVGLSNMELRNFFFAYAALNLTVAISDFHQLRFRDCAIGIYSRVQEQNSYRRIEFIKCGAGIVVGGQWSNRNDNYLEQGGFGDKCSYDQIRFTYERNYQVGKDDAIDTFFDDYFFKTINNTTRLSRPILGYSIAKTAKYYGITGIMIAIYSRYMRNSNNNSFSNLFHGFTHRYCVTGNMIRCSEVTNVNLESVGWAEVQNTGLGYTRGGAVGSDFTDPYLGTGVRLPSIFPGFQPDCTFRNIQAQKCYAANPIPPVVQWIGLDAINGMASDFSGGNLPANKIDNDLQPVLTGIQSTVPLLGYRSPSWNTVTAVPGQDVTMTFRLQDLQLQRGTFHGVLMVSANGSADQALLQQFSLIYIPATTFRGLVKINLVGPVVASNGDLVPTNLRITDPAADGSFTVTVTNPNKPNSLRMSSRILGLTRTSTWQ